MKIYLKYFFMSSNTNRINFNIDFPFRTGFRILQVEVPKKLVVKPIKNEVFISLMTMYSILKTFVPLRVEKHSNSSILREI